MKINPKEKKFRFFTALSLFLFSLFFISQFEREPEPTELDNVIEKGEITVITRNNGHCYYQNHGIDQGFEFDLAKTFADSIGVRLNVLIYEKWDDMYRAMEQHPGAFIAAGITMTPERSRQAAFSSGYLKVHEYLVVNRDNQDIRTVEDLNLKTVFVEKGTPQVETLSELRRRGIRLKIQKVGGYSAEEFMRMVEEKKIGITVIDGLIARLNRKYYPNAVISGPVSPTRYLRWAVRPTSGALLKKINGFLQDAEKSGLIKKLYDKYYGETEILDENDLITFHGRMERLLPRYSSTIKMAAERYGFDWKIIAAMIYQESRFNTSAISKSGAFGLMQLVPKTASLYGAEDLFDPEQNILAGVAYLKRLYAFFDRAAGMDRLLIALAAYNAGLGHIRDARNLARDKKLDPNLWSSLSKTLPLLSRRKYYEKSIYGYCRGKQTVTYVDNILKYFDILKVRGVEYAFRDTTSDLNPG